VPAAPRELGLRLPTSAAVTERTKAFARRAGGPRIYYELSGQPDGEPLVLIRGLGRSSSYWLEFRDILERTRRLLVLDNRGVGRSDTPRWPWTTADMADDVALVLRESGVQSSDVLGISLGGMVAQELALRHPHRVRRLILLCTTPGGPNAKRIAPEAALALARSASMPFEEGLRYSAPWVLSADTLARRPEIVDIWIAIAASEPRSRTGVVAQLLAGASHDASTLLRHIAHETLVATGDSDRLISPKNSELIAGLIPNATLRMLRGAAHDFPTERPDETARLVLDFLG
jgi:3-oxoadipate enol-lactonase